MTESDEKSVDVADLVQLLFKNTRQQSNIGRILAQMTDMNDSVGMTVDWMDEDSRNDFIAFLMTELHTSYECIMILAREIVAMQEGPAI